MSTITSVFKSSAKLQSAIGFGIIILGIIAMYSPFIAGVVVSELLAITIAASSLAICAYAFKASSTKRKIFQFIAGIIGIVAAVSCYLTPMLGLVSLTLIAISYFIIDGVFMLYGAYEQRGQKGNGWVVVSGLSSLLLAGVLIAEWPLSGMYAVGMLVGAKLIVTGWTMTMLGMVEYRINENIETLDEELESSTNSVTPA